MKLLHVLATKGPTVHTCAPGTPVREAVERLRTADVGALVVVDGNRPVGMISERDIVRQIDRGDILGTPVDALMTPVRAGTADGRRRELVCGTPEDDVERVLETMVAHHFRHLPVVQDGALVGIVTTGDLARVLLDSLRGSVDTLEAQVMADDHGG
jgi:CBS domain-containing protein